MYGKLRLIAGAAASFDHPGGLALADGGRTILVADTGHGSLRAIHLDQGNQVETLVGRGARAGDSALIRPTDLAASRDGAEAWIYDRGTRKLYRWQASKKKLSVEFTLAPGQDPGDRPLGLVLSADGKEIYFIDPAEGRLMRGAIGQGTLTEMLQDAVLKEAGAFLFQIKGELRCYLDAHKKIMKVAGTRFEEVLPAVKEGGIQALTAARHADGSEGVLAWDSGTASFVPVEGNLRRIPIIDHMDVDRSSGPFTQAFLNGPLSLAYDTERGILYACERDAGRVLAIRDDEFSLEKSFLKNHGFARTKPPGVKRILFLGTSLMFGSDEEYDLLAWSIPNRFETFLNQESALENKGQYEVVRGADGGGPALAPDVYLLQHPDLLKDYQFDYVFLVMNDRNLYWDAIAWSLVETQDDVPLSTLDPEWAMKPLAEKAKSMGPISREIVELIRTHPKEYPDLISFTAEALPDFKYVCCMPRPGFMKHPALRQLAFSIQAKILAKAKALCERSGATPIFWVLPNISTIGNGEGERDFGSFNDLSRTSELAADYGKLLESKGLATVNLLDPLRVFEPELFPVRVGGHFIYRSENWMAYLMALTFMERFGGAQ